jgi:hypothetical protein
MACTEREKLRNIRKGKLPEDYFYKINNDNDEAGIIIMPAFLFWKFTRRFFIFFMGRLYGITGKAGFQGAISCQQSRIARCL